MSCRSVDYLSGESDAGLIAAMTSWLLVHSPLLGPGSWAGVAAELSDTGGTVAVPDLRPALAARSGFAEPQAALAADAVSSGPVSVAAHSGAGPLLPSVAAAQTGRGIPLDRCMFVDAGLPHPGRSRRATLPESLASHLDSISEHGVLPPWPRWWPAQDLAELLPDADVRATLDADCPPLPAELFTEPLPAHHALPPAGYLQLSDVYAEPAAMAEADGWPVHRLAADHLAPLTRPREIAHAMLRVHAETSALRNAARRHVARFNRAVRDGNWATFVERFAKDATMRFTNVSVGPFVGRPAILHGYRQQPPDDTMSISSVEEVAHDTVHVAFAWDAGGQGTMRITWSGELVADLAITFG